MLGTLLQHRVLHRFLRGNSRVAGEVSLEEETFGQRIRRLRRERGLTQRQLAEAVGLDFTYLSKVENDRGEPPGEETVRRLADVLAVDVEDLLALGGEV